MTKNKHLTLDERILIQSELIKGTSKSQIARIIDKDKSTVCKEIKKRSTIEYYKKYGARNNGTYDCSKIKECGFNGYCPCKCDQRINIPCMRKDKNIGICNGCENFKSCRLDKIIYDPYEAQEDYNYTLHDSREGVNLTTSQALELGNIIKDPINNGQSIYAIKQNHHEIIQCEKTLYNYIDQGVFSESGIINLNLRKKVSRKSRTKPIKSKPRENRAYLKGRTYNDYRKYLDDHPSFSNGIVEMDTVYNDGSNGPFIQTFQFVEFSLMIGLYHKEKTASAMLSGVQKLHDMLGDELFKKHVKIILTDRGNEFTAAQAIETLGCKIFYCDPMASYQKPHVENNHLMFRFICPKKHDLTKDGLVGQDDLDLIFSHINSYKRKELHGRSPIELFEFYYPNSDLLKRLNIKEIDHDEIILKPELIKKN